MTAEELLKKAKNQPTPDKEQIRRARITAVVLGSATIVTLAFMVFAFIEKENAEQLRKELQRAQSELQECRASK